MYFCLCNVNILMLYIPSVFCIPGKIISQARLALIQDKGGIPMENPYHINEWARVRRDELVDIPEEPKIHPHFLHTMDRPEFEAAFRTIWDLFYRIYDDISKMPEAFHMPLFLQSEFQAGSKQARQSRKAPWRPVDLLYYMALCSNVHHSFMHVNVHKFKENNTVKQIHTLLEPLTDYGFAFIGLAHFKIPGKLDSFIVEYPDDPNVLTVLHLVAVKAANVGRNNEINRYTDDFASWNYRILEDDMHTIRYGDGVEYVADKVHTPQEREFVYEFDKTIREKGWFCCRDSWNEGPGLCYYDKESTMRKKGPYVFKIMSWKSKLKLYLRIRNVDNCLEFLKECPDSVREMFLYNDTGCSNQHGKVCKGISYVLDGKEYWHCGCCSPAFQTAPLAKDIPYYWKLVELGRNK